MISQAFWAKFVVSLFAAMGMYWMRIPHQVVLLMYAQTADLFMGVLVAAVLGLFTVRQLGRGILLKASAYPLLAICDLAEEPLHLAFHLDSYVALALIAYEFLSVVENYSRIRPLPKIVQLAAEKAQEYLATSAPATAKMETKRIEVEPTAQRPYPPAPIVITTVTQEAHTEPATPAESPKP